ncbi:MAG: EsaB/YukD family protein [Micrococcales bacterium]|nr:EsaB/YukD family protein [Micrococcales bacterium]
MLRVTVSGLGRNLGVHVPAQVPVVALTPFIVRQLGGLGPTAVGAGYQLQRLGHQTLDPDQSLAAQGVDDGERLNLVRGAIATRAHLYDDMVEAVITATGRRAAWTPQDHARTALGVALTLLALGATVLVTIPRASMLTATIALGGAVALVATGTVLVRARQPEAGHGLGLAAAVYGGVGAYLLTPGDSLWAWPLAAAGLGMIVAGGTALATTGSAPRVHLVPIITGTTLGLTAAAAALLADGGPPPVAPYALLVAVLGTLSNALPWMVLASTRLTALAPQSETDILGDAPKVDENDVDRRTSQSHTLLLALRLALGLTVLTATPMVASTGVAGALLCVLVFTGMMFESRQVYARVEVGTLMGTGTLGLALTGTTIAITESIDHTWLLGGLLTATVILVGLAMLTERARIRLSRLHDAAEITCLAALLPLGIITAGLL